MMSTENIQRPKIVDFGTIGAKEAKKGTSSGPRAGSSSGTPSPGLLSRIWPLNIFFGSSKPTTEAIQSTSTETYGISPLDEVIAMKKLQEGNDTDDFIDIQVRKLSYAEAASLRRDGRQPVVDQDKELEKSITDIEFMNAYKKQKRFDPEEYESKVEEAEEWVNEKRVPKRFSKHRRRGERDN